MADISKIQPIPTVQKVQNLTYRVHDSEGVGDQKRHREEREAPHDKLELHEEPGAETVETPPEAHTEPDPPEDHGLDIAV